MSFLENFAGSFLTGLGNEGMRRADEERQLKLQEALERRRIRMQYEAKYDLEPQAPTPFGAPVQRGPGNWVQQTKVPTRAQFDDENRIIQPSLMQEGPEYTVPDPYALDPKGAAMMDYRERQLAQQAELSRERSAALRARGNSADRPMGEAERRRLELEERRENRLSQGRAEDSASASGTKYSKALEAERTRASRWADSQMKRFEKMDPAKALSTIKSETGVTAPTLPAYRELLIQQAMAPWEKENPAPKSEGMAPKSEGLQDPPPELLDEAKAAIAQGKSRAAVIQRLKENGYSAKGL
ncbi:MAG: hypothetical protein IPK64_19840 [bacterium]|nr:hypothetical protein [bacterium]